MKGRFTVILLTTALVTGMVGCFSGNEYGTPTPSHQLPATRQLTENTLGVREYWRTNCSYLSGDIPQPNLLAQAGRVLCLGYVPAERTNHLRVLDAKSGRVVWEIKGRSPESGGHLTVDAKRVYVMPDFEIRAYDFNDGRFLWESPKLPDHRVYYLYSDGDKLHARDNSLWTFYNLDARTGELLGSDSLLAGDNFALLAKLPGLDLYTSARILKATEKASQQVLWTTDIERLGPILRPPVLLGDVLLVGTKQQVFAIDTQTGQIKWRNKDNLFASNFIVVNGFLYAIDINARLTKLDAKTGQERGHIQFTPAWTDSKGSYWVAADGQMLFVSFDDSQELIGLGP